MHDLGLELLIWIKLYLRSTLIYSCGGQKNEDEDNKPRRPPFAG